MDGTRHTPIKLIVQIVYIWYLPIEQAKLPNTTQTKNSNLSRCIVVALKKAFFVLFPDIFVRYQNGYETALTTKYSIYITFTELIELKTLANIE